MSKSPALTDISALLAATEGYVAQIVAEADAKALATEKRGSNADTRKAAHLASLVKANKKVKGSTADLAPTTDALRGFSAKSKALAAIVDKAIDGLDDEQAVVVMSQILDGKLIKELIEATYEAGRAAVYHTMNVSAAEQGEEFPEHTNMVLDVPELGKRFCREGAGRKPASLDEDKLIELIGEDTWNEITSEQVIPATVVRVIDETKLIAAVAADASLLEQVRAAVVPGDWKSPRLTIKPIPTNEKE